MVRKSTSWPVLIYGILISMLGYWGYYQSGSLISLYSGVGFGALLVLGSIAMFVGWKWGSIVALIATVALTAVFAIRYSMTNKSTPAIMAVLSGGMLLFLLFRVARWRR